MRIRAGQRLWPQESGATAIEYGLIAAMIASVILAIAQTGGAVDVLYNVLGLVANAMGQALES